MHDIDLWMITPVLNTVYDAVNTGLYALSGPTGGATLPFATAMTLAQGAAGVDDIIEHKPNVSNIIDTASLIPGLGLTKVLSKQTAKVAAKGAAKAIAQEAAPTIVKKGETILGSQASKAIADYSAK